MCAAPIFLQFKFALWSQAPHTCYHPASISAFSYDTSHLSSLYMSSHHRRTMILSEAPPSGSIVAYQALLLSTPLPLVRLVPPSLYPVILLPGHQLLLRGKLQNALVASWTFPHSFLSEGTARRGLLTSQLDDLSFTTSGRPCFSLKAADRSREARHGGNLKTFTSGTARG